MDKTNVNSGLTQKSTEKDNNSSLTPKNNLFSSDGEKYDRIKLIVLNEHTLGFVFPSLPNNCQILHASILKGAIQTQGSVLFSKRDKVRLASEQDFENFRVDFGSFGNSEEYIYEVIQ